MALETDKKAPVLAEGVAAAAVERDWAAEYVAPEVIARRPWMELVEAIANALQVEPEHTRRVLVRELLLREEGVL